MLISVVIPLYNKEQYIGSAVSSVLSQTFHDVEVIVINDGSTDGGAAIVHEYGDRRIRLIDQKNQGVSAARNRGIAEARGELIAFLDADDEWLPDFLHTIHELSVRFPSAGVYVTGFRLLKRGRLIYRDMAIRTAGDECGSYFDLYRRGARAHSSCVAVRRLVFNEIRPFRMGHYTGEDVDLWVRMAVRYEFACSTKICSLYHYYLPDNFCHNTAPEGIHALYPSLHEMKEDRDLLPSVRKKATRYAAAHLRRDIRWMLQLGMRDAAWKRLREYYQLFGPTGAYVGLSLLHVIPSTLLVYIGRARVRVVQWALSRRIARVRNRRLGDARM